MTVADIGYGSFFGIEGAVPGTYVTVAEVVSIQLPALMREAVEATHLQSPGQTKEYIPGMKDLGEITLTLNWVPSVNNAMVAAFEDETGKYQITAPDGWRFQCAGFFTEYGLPQLTNEKMEATATIRPTGPMTLLPPL